MKNTTLLSSSMSLAVPSPRPGPRLPSLFVAIAMLLLLLSIASSTYADSATWKSSPATGDWNTAANWTPMTVPNGPSDTATFATSNRTAVSLSAYTEVNGIVFNAGASAFTITVSPANLGRLLTISGVGITNDSGVIQHFVTASGPGILDFGEFSFSNSATAGSETVYTNSGDGPGIPAQIGFGDSSNAGNGIFINEGGAPAGDQGGVTFFVDHATAANGTFINNGAAVRNAPGGLTIFFGGTAEDATLIANGGAEKVSVGESERPCAGRGRRAGGQGKTRGGGGGRNRTWFGGVSRPGVSTGPGQPGRPSHQEPVAFWRRRSLQCGGERQHRRRR